MNNTQAHANLHPSAKLFRIKAEYRRIAVYLLISYIVLMSAIIGLNLAGVGGGWDRVIIGVPVFSVLLLALPLLIFRQRLRIDDAGVWRRRLFGWDLWPWEAFTSGHVKHGTYRDSFIYPGKPWWHRYLYLEFLEAREREAVARLLGDLLTPAPIDVPESLELSYGFGKRLFLSPNGVRLARNKRRGGDLYGWSEVRQVRIKRIDHTRRDFHQLEINLPEPAQPIVLRIFRGSPTWKGADADVIMGFLERYVSSDRIEITAVTGPPRDTEECARRLADIDRDEQRLRRARRWMVPAVGVGVAAHLTIMLAFGKQPANPLQWHWYKIVVFAAYITMLALVGIAVWMGPTELLARLKKQRDELNAWYAQQAHP